MATKEERTLLNGEKKVFYKIGHFTFKEETIQKFMPAKDLNLQLQWMKDTEIRNDDVIICAFPKTGTHWRWEIVNMVLQGSAEYHKDTKEAAMLEFCSKEMTSSLKSPRVMNTHFSYDYLPDGIRGKRCKIIHVMRNPKDVVVSFYHHLKKQSEVIGSAVPPSFDTFIKVFLGQMGEPYYCSYMWYIKDWVKVITDNPGYPILNIFYENLKKDPDGEIRKIATFLDKDINDGLISDISAKCSYDNLKQAHEKKIDAFKENAGGKGSGFLYRKGTVGDWKNHLTVAQSEEIDCWVEKELKGLDIDFIYHL